jgi:hypothetical protein
MIGWLDVALLVLQPGFVMWLFAVKVGGPVRDTPSRVMAE